MHITEGQWSEKEIDFLADAVAAKEDRSVCDSKYNQSQNVEVGQMMNIPEGHQSKEEIDALDDDSNLEEAKRKKKK